MILPTTSRNSQGVQVINLRKKAVLESAEIISAEAVAELEKYRAKSVPAAGKPAKEMGDSNQLTF
jgi:DNA gyrase subunit A